MFNIMYDQDLTTANFNPIMVNSKAAILAEHGIQTWTTVKIKDWHSITTCDNAYYNRFSLTSDVKTWLKLYCQGNWRYWRDTDNGIQLCFIFKDPNIAMLFRLTWC